MRIAAVFVSGVSCRIVEAAVFAKTYPGDATWPNEREWQSFNQSIRGSLLKPNLKNTGHYETKKVSACFISDADFESSPFLLKTPWWGGFGCPSCPVHYATETCSLGNHPPYVVKAMNAQQVSESMQFANKHNIRIVIKNTGHDFLGRNVGYGSLEIWTHHLRGVKWESRWTPTGQSGINPQSAIVYGSGEQWKEIYKQAYSHGKIVTGGTDGTVGAGGGWLFGGGHGFFTNRYGLGVDNLLEAEVVLPTGQIITANAKTYPDLFWALRGGGGGTFGVVTKVTMKVHPGESLEGVSVSVTSGLSGIAGFVKGMAYLMSVMPQWVDFGITGHPILARYQFNSLFTAPGKSSAAINAFLATFVGRLRLMGLSVTTKDISSAINSRTMSQNLALNAGLPGNKVGGPGIMASRLLGREGLKDVDSLEEALKYLLQKNYAIEPFNIGGGAVAANRNVDISLNPHWRDAIIHFSILPLSQWSLKTNVEVQKSFEETQKDLLKYVDKLSVGSAVYINEASWMEPQWKKSYFGVNYDKLLKIKQKYDPNNTLWCHPCVGADVFSQKSDGKLYI